MLRAEMMDLAAGIKDDESGRVLRGGILIAANASLIPIIPDGASEGLGGYVISQSGLLVKDRFATVGTWFGHGHDGATINSPLALRPWLADLAQFSKDQAWSAQDISQLAVATETFFDLREYGDHDGLVVVHAIGTNQEPYAIDDARGMMYA